MEEGRKEGRARIASRQEGFVVSQGLFGITRIWT